MNILVLGAGKVGRNIAKNLARQTFDVCIVDVDIERLKSIQEDHDLAIVQGHASSPEILKKAGANIETVVLAVTNDDEVNIVACQLAKKLFNVSKTICRLSDYTYIENLDALGKDNIDVAISPELEVTQHIVDLINHPGAEQIESFAEGKVKLVSVKAKKDGKLVNRELKSIKSDLPEDIETRDKVLLAAMGSPDNRQIDGLGGADPVKSKVAIVSKSDEAGVDVNYHFAQVKIDEPIVDTKPSCGNMLIGVGPFSIERGLVEAQDGLTKVIIRDVNTGMKIEETVRTPNKIVSYEGDLKIDGVPNPGSPVDLNFLEVIGSKTKKLFPTGNKIDKINGILQPHEVLNGLIVVQDEWLPENGLMTPTLKVKRNELAERYQEIVQQHAEAKAVVWE